MSGLATTAMFASQDVECERCNGECKYVGVTGGKRDEGHRSRFERDFEAAEYDLVGIQESRIQSDADVNKDKYHIIGAAATPSDTLGVPFWVAHRLRATLIDVRSVDPRNFFVVQRCFGITYHHYWCGSLVH